MKRRYLAPALLAMIIAAPAGPVRTGESPEASGRTNAQNYKDMVLAQCVARAYKKEPMASSDAGSSGGALVEWTLYDAEHSPEAIDLLIGRYLDRDYHNPLVEYKGVEFGLLKCLDLYHSKDLEAQVKRFVIHPDWVYDKPPSQRQHAP